MYALLYAVVLLYVFIRWNVFSSLPSFNIIPSFFFLYNTYTVAQTASISLHDKWSKYQPTGYVIERMLIEDLSLPKVKNKGTKNGLINNSEKSYCPAHFIVQWTIPDTRWQTLYGNIVHSLIKISRHQRWKRSRIKNRNIENIYNNRILPFTVRITKKKKKPKSLNWKRLSIWIKNLMQPMNMNILFTKCFIYFYLSNLLRCCCRGFPLPSHVHIIIWLFLLWFVFSFNVHWAVCALGNVEDPWVCNRIHVA